VEIRLDTKHHDAEGLWYCTQQTHYLLLSIFHASISQTQYGLWFLVFNLACTVSYSKILSMQGWMTGYWIWLMIMNLKGNGRKQLGPNLSIIVALSCRDWGKPQKRTESESSAFQSRLHQTPSEYYSEALLFEPTCLINHFHSDCFF
jgi:hypothetical protein